MTDWQPISTAPRDGRAILACMGDYSEEAYEETRSLWPSRAPVTVYWGTHHPNSPGKNEWRDGNGHRRPHLTHWMPLPKPPGKRGEETR